MEVSIIIPIYNEEDGIEDCLESLSKQTFKDFEIIVVDDGSTDGSFEKLQGSEQVQILRQKHKGAGAARNLGANRAKGDILVFVDADMTFDKDFIKRLISPIAAGRVKGTFSKEEFVENWGNRWARGWSINEGWEPRRRHPKNYPDYQPVFRAILKSEFERVGGFTPGGYDDDWSLSRKLGYEAINAPGAVFYHKNPAALSEVFNQARWVGKRKYKYGYVGYMAALVRASLPVSLVVGLYKSFIFHLPSFILFKIVYDFGVFIGILEYIFGKVSK